MFIDDMDKKESRKTQEIKNATFDNKSLKDPSISNKYKEKSLPWWVELLFVQIGLPDKWLIKVLKGKKRSSQFIKDEKRFIFTLFFIIIALGYFYPVVKNSKTKLDCENIAKKYLRENKNLKNINKKQINMLSTNFCNGGGEIYEIENNK